LLTLHAADPGILDALRSVDVSLLTTANNHAFDLGAGGVLDTLDAVRAAGLSASGSGASLAAAAAPAFVSTPAGRVAVVGFATGKVRDGGAATPTRPGVNELRRTGSGVPDAEDEARILGAIREAAAGADLVIACHHNHDWEPDNAQVPAWQQALARRCVDAGADVFAGHGSPVPQGMSLYRGRPLMYGLGNFIFQTEKVAGSYPAEAWTSVIAHVARRRDGSVETSLEAITMNETGLGGSDDLATRGFPTLAGDEAAALILDRIDALSRPLGGRILRTANGGRLQGLV
jgi:poly-gamma-glutamate synthesis protein (capsule biosynthesis protein)